MTSVIAFVITVDWLRCEANCQALLYVVCCFSGLSQSPSNIAASKQNHHKRGYVVLGAVLQVRKCLLGMNRELKIETFSGRRRPDWQSKPGTEVAVASLQNSNIKIAVNSGGRRLGRLPKRKIWLHIKN